ncbi:sensor histidine kinase [Acinetobacter sp. WCHAc010052]|uniref:sensor histidine kinase n=1 Tax=Acinetobacter sp. WCHAc010052 TaxID=2004647 RepID=UPI000B3C9DCF|nr:HAMP domain-containing sensor histidine kinase [Acinetobacter sp. WCHAc010052]AXY60139.1 two-component sensor histidine kinase [Acinetobacter sp. WCHAc010052]
MKRYSLKWRLVLTVTLSFILIWIIAFGWLYLSLNKKMNQTLDNRLSASAHMVARLLNQMPLDQLKQEVEPAVSEINQNNLIACEVSIFSSDVAIGKEIVARTRGAPDSMIHRKQGFSTWTDQGVEWRSYVLQKGELQVVSAERMHTRSMLLYEVLSSVLLPLLLTLIICISLILWMIRLEFQPIDRITSHLSSLDGKVNQELQYLHQLQTRHLPQEIEPFVSAMVDLVHRLHDSLENEKNLSAFASHELRSPLTAIKTHVQLSRMIAVQEHSSAGLISNLQEAEQNIERYRQFLEQLLLLSQTEHQPQLYMEQVSLKTVIESVMTEFSRNPDLLPVIQVNWESLVNVRFSSDALTMIIRNVLENSIKHAQSLEPIQIYMQNDSLYIADTGVGLSDEELRVATHRFWRKSSQSQGYGIGLALTHELMKQAGHELILKKNDPQGLVVILKFNA